MMTTEELIARSRLYLNDKDGKIFTDDELKKFIEQSAKEYCEDTEIFRDEFDFVKKDGEYKYPSDYIHFVIGWNKDGKEIEAKCSHDLERYWSEYSSKTGSPLFIYDDTCDEGKYKLCPEPNEEETVDEYIWEIEKPYQEYGVKNWCLGIDAGGLGELFTDIPNLDYGEIYDDNYGVTYSTNKLDEDYGVIYQIDIYNFVGDASYVRYRVASKIPDHVALLYNILSQAYEVDSDITSADKASLFRNYYNARISLFNRCRKELVGETKALKYF